VHRKQTGQFCPRRQLQQRLSARWHFRAPQAAATRSTWACARGRRPLPSSQGDCFSRAGSSRVKGSSSAWQPRPRDPLLPRALAHRTASCPQPAARSFARRSRALRGRHAGHVAPEVSAV